MLMSISGLSWLFVALCLLGALIAFGFFIRYLNTWHNKLKAAAPHDEQAALPPIASKQDYRSINDYLIERLATLRSKVSGASWRYRVPTYLMVGDDDALMGDLLRNLSTDTSGPASSSAYRLHWHFLKHINIIQIPMSYIHATNKRMSDGLWEYLLDKLNALRPKRPLDGIIVLRTLENPSPDVLEKQHESDDLDKNLRDRLLRLQQRLCFKLPVYVVMTHCQQRKGCAAFWQNLPDSYRQEMWGWTNPHSLSETFEQAWISAAFKSVVQSLNRLKLTRLNSQMPLVEPDGFFLFPYLFQKIESSLKLSLGTLFSPSSYHTSLWLRGLYFSAQLKSGKADKPKTAFLADFLDKKLPQERHLAKPIEGLMGLLEQRVKRWISAALVLATVLIGGVFIEGYALRSQVKQEMQMFAQLTAAQTIMKHGESEKAASMLLESLNEVAFHSLEGYWFLWPARQSNFTNEGIKYLGEVIENVLFVALRGRIDHAGNSLISTTSQHRPVINSRATKKPVSLIAYDETPKTLEVLLSDIERLNSLLDDLHKFNKSLIKTETISINQYHQFGKLVEVYVNGGQKLSTQFYEEGELNRRAIAMIGADSVVGPLNTMDYINHALKVLQQRSLNIKNSLLGQDYLYKIMSRIKFSLNRILIDQKDGEEGAHLSAVNLQKHSATLNNLLQRQTLKNWQAVTTPLTAPPTDLPSRLQICQALESKLTAFSINIKSIKQETLELGLYDKKIFNQQSLAIDFAKLIASMDDLIHQFSPQQCDIKIQQALLARAASTIKQFSPLVAYNKDAGTWVIHPKLATLNELFQPIVAQSLKNKQPQVTKLEGEDSRPILWQSKQLLQALDSVATFDQYQEKARSNYDRSAAQILEKALHGELHQQLGHFIHLAQLPLLPNIGFNTAKPIGREIIQTVVDNIKANQAHLIKLQAALTQRQFSHLNDHLIKQSQNQALFVLNGTRALVRQDNLYLPARSIAAWPKQQALSIYAYQLNDPSELDAYLAQQRERLFYLNDKVISPAISLLNSLAKDNVKTPKLSDIVALNFWQTTQQVVQQYRDKIPSNDLSDLEGFFQNQVIALTGSNCSTTVLAAAESIEVNPGLVNQNQRSLLCRIAERCSEFHASTLVNEYQDMAQAFNQRLSGLYPFVGPLQGASLVNTAQSLEVEQLASFFAQYSASLDRLEPVPASPGINRFLKDLQAVRDFIQPLLVEDSRGRILNARLTLNFDVLTDQSQGTHQIIASTLKIGSQSLTDISGTQSVNWQSNDPITFTLRWAADSLVSPSFVPARDDALLRIGYEPAFSDQVPVIEGDTVRFSAEGRWSLLKFLQQYRASFAFFPNGRDQNPHVLQFVTSTQDRIKPTDQANDTQTLANALRFIRVQIAAIESDQGLLQLPQVFPAQAPRYQASTAANTLNLKFCSPQ